MARCSPLKKTNLPELAFSENFTVPCRRADAKLQAYVFAVKSYSGIRIAKGLCLNRSGFTRKSSGSVQASPNPSRETQRSTKRYKDIRVQGIGESFRAGPELRIAARPLCWNVKVRMCECLNVRKQEFQRVPVRHPFFRPLRAVATQKTG